MFRTPWRSTFVRRRVGFKRFCLKKYGSLPVFCAQARGVFEVSHLGAAIFVHGRLGFKSFLCVAMLLWCTGAWVLSDFDASLK